MKKIVLILVLLIALCFSGCYYEDGLFLPANETDASAAITSDALAVDNLYDPSITGASVADIPTQTAVAIPEEYASLPRKVVKEGELIQFPNLSATDPDGDAITYTFTEPLNAQGEWQTANGDVGYYKVTITASDGTNQVAQDVVLVVEESNHAPVIAAIEPISVKEGEEVKLAPAVTDADGDSVDVSISGWMEGDSYITTFADAGEHTVTITASDGKATTTQDVVVRVEDVNRAPVVDPIGDVIVTEYDKLIVNATGSDPDGDTLTFTYSEPLNENGEWKTSKGDAGKYRVTITANDGKTTAEHSFFVIVESSNHLPVIDAPESIVVDEGDLITLDYTVTDEDEDEVEVTLSGWMTSKTYQTTFDDAGTYKVTITAKDKDDEVTHEIAITVQNKNRAPVFEAGAFK